MRAYAQQQQQQACHLKQRFDHTHTHTLTTRRHTFTLFCRIRCFDVCLRHAQSHTHTHTHTHTHNTHTLLPSFLSLSSICSQHYSQSQSQSHHARVPSLFLTRFDFFFTSSLALDDDDDDDDDDDAVVLLVPFAATTQTRHQHTTHTPTHTVSILACEQLSLECAWHRLGEFSVQRWRWHEIIVPAQVHK